jgi:hypothetical protein
MAAPKTQQTAKAEARAKTQSGRLMVGTFLSPAFGVGWLSFVRPMIGAAIS